MECSNVYAGCKQNMDGPYYEVHLKTTRDNFEALSFGDRFGISQQTTLLDC